MLKLTRMRTAFDRAFRNEQNDNLKKIEDATGTLESKMDALLSGKIDDVALQTDIEQKLNDLETQYAPKLTEVSAQLDDIAINVKTFGAVGGNSDDTISIKTAIENTPIGGTLYFPYLGSATLGYKVTQPIVISKRINIKMDSPIIYAGEKNQTALKISPPDSDYLRYMNFKVGVISSSDPTVEEWSDDNYRGIVLENMLNCTIEVTHARKFGRGLTLIAGGETIGTGRGFAWNEIKLGHISDNRLNLVIQSLGNGWPNANVFRGGSLGYSNGFLPSFSGRRVNVSFLKSNNYGSNSNVFYDVAFEGGRSIANGETRCIYIQDLNRYIRFVNCRFEDVVPLDSSKGSIVFMDRPSGTQGADIKVDGFFTHAYTFVVATDGKPILIGDCEVIENLSPTSREKWDVFFTSGALSEHYLYGVDNGSRYAFDNVKLFSTITSRVGDVSFSDNADVLDYNTKQFNINPGVGIPCIKVSVQKGDRFKVYTDGRYIVATQNESGSRLDMPNGDEIICTANGSFVRFGNSYTDYYQANVIGKNEAEIIVNSDLIKFLIIGISVGSFFNVYKAKSNKINTFENKKDFKSSTIPKITPIKDGIIVLKTTLSGGQHMGWVSVGNSWKGYGMIES